MRVHNHDYDPSCHESATPEGLRGECVLAVDPAPVEKAEPVYDYCAQAYALSQADDEMLAQIKRWGIQDHPLIGGTMPTTQRGWYAHEEQKYKRRFDVQHKAGNRGWDTILLEEVYEALASRTVEEQVEELVQVAAVALAAALSVQRQAA